MTVAKGHWNGATAVSDYCGGKEKDGCDGCEKFHFDKTEKFYASLY
jgi:hypothetical protein